MTDKLAIARALQEIGALLELKGGEYFKARAYKLGARAVAELNEGKVSSALMDVSWLGIPRASVAELQGGEASQNAETIEGILSGKITGAKRT